MTALAWLVPSAWTGLCGAWVSLLVAQRQARRQGMELEARPAGVLPPGMPDVCVVIPARNEASTIGACIDRVLAQDYPNLGLMVVDDRSEDATASIVAARAARSERPLALRKVLFVPRGWLAKSHALWFGAADLQAEWLLFLDADCTLSPQAVRTVLCEAIERHADGLSLWPRNGAIGFFEHLLIPLCAGIVALWFGVRELRQPGASGFINGQFLLIRRDAYQRIGGHASVRRAIIEDIALADVTASAGLAVPSMIGRDLVSVRMYDSLRGICEGWARIYVGALRKGPKIALSVFWLLLGSLLPFIAAPILLFRLNSDRYDRSTTTILLGLCAAHMLLIGLVSCRFWRFGGCLRRYLWLYPLSVIIVACILIRAGWWLAVRRSVVWRGTRYAIDGKGQIVE